MFDSLVNLLSDQWWGYLLVLGLSLLDVLLPVLPSETAMITGGIIAAEGGMAIWLVVGLGAVGAWAGDNIAYTIGDKAQGWARRWIMRGQRGRRSLEWAEGMLHRHGGSLVIVARFVPGGRTATTVACGVLGFPRPRFMAFDAIGAATWALANAFVGYLGGQAFSERTFLAFAMSFGVSLLVAGVIELGRWGYGRRHGHERSPEGTRS